MSISGNCLHLLSRYNCTYRKCFVISKAWTHGRESWHREKYSGRVVVSERDHGFSVEVAVKACRDLATPIFFNFL